MCGMSESPMSVSRYSTLGGTTGYAFLEISPSASSVRSVPDNTRDETSGISLHSSLNRITSCSWMMSRTRKAHLFPNRAMTLRMGQNSMMEFFSSFSAYSDVDFLVRIICQNFVCKATIFLLFGRYSVVINFFLIFYVINGLISCKREKKVSR